MRLVWAAIGAIAVAATLSACGRSAPHPYPESARARFEASCPSASAVCVCTWEEITRTVTYEDYEVALQRFRAEGLMDPRVTRARTKCIERHPE
ncbi:MAG TPA: hypothetical protein VEA80_06280 [Vitreimonas sp.]|uniref:hypothetical protein n=1 Tax=Vitreimonas sp. TaxID=3069702 RepID=UPI002D49B198|nr:hypothetical protein [Vitreimonas sp.]HYD87061.1 hypothetical protein [Vitreimonas sp.]